MKKAFVSSIDEVVPDDSLDFFNEFGYVVYTDVLGKNDCDQIKAILAALKNFMESSGALFTHVDDYLNLRIWSLLSHTRALDYIITSKFLNSIMSKIFQRDTSHRLYTLSSFQGVILQPGAKQQKLHIDTPCPEPIPVIPLKANSIWCLDDWTAENGATEIVPKTHKSGKKPMGNLSEDASIIKLIAPQGSVIVTDGALWHRGGANRSRDCRYSVFASFAASWLKYASVEDDIVRRFISPDMLDGRSEELLQIIGYYDGIRSLDPHMRARRKEIKL